MAIIPWRQEYWEFKASHSYIASWKQASKKFSEFHELGKVMHTQTARLLTKLHLTLQTEKDC